MCDLGWRAFLAYTATPTIWRGRVGWTPAHLRWTWLVEFELGLHGPSVIEAIFMTVGGAVDLLSHVNFELPIQGGSVLNSWLLPDL